MSRGATGQGAYDENYKPLSFLQVGRFAQFDAAKNVFAPLFFEIYFVFYSWIVWIVVEDHN